jgi:hypothetical protein
MNNEHPHWADRAIAVFTGLMLITYITGNYFSCQQLKLTQGTFEELKKGGSDTHDLAEAAKRQAETSRAIAEAARAQVESSKAIAERALAQAKATNDIASQARRSANTAEQALGLQARPWVGLDGSVTIESIGVVSTQGFEVKFTYTVKNFGSVPALYVVSSAKIGIERHTRSNASDNALRDQSDRQCLFADTNYAPRGTVFTGNQPPAQPQRPGPAAEFTGATVFPDQRFQMGMSVNDRSGLSDGFDPGASLWGVGCVAYLGPTGPVHHTRFCFSSQGPANQIKPGEVMLTCHTNNIAD